MADLDDVRDWIGNSPDDAAVTAVLERFLFDTQPTVRASLSILRRRRADLDGTGSRSFSVDGDVSWGAVSKDAVTGLDRKIAQLEALLGEEPPVDDLPALTSAPIVAEHCLPLHHGH